jgi:hypothetical protein
MRIESSLSFKLLVLLVLTLSSHSSSLSIFIYFFCFKHAKHFLGFRAETSALVILYHNHGPVSHTHIPHAIKDNLKHLQALVSPC